MINARAETAAEKPAFKEAIRRRRCLLPASGFFEWQKVGARKLPHLIRLRDGMPFALAGLWERWRPRGGGEPVESCTILTTEPNDLVAELHNRMPVILDPERFDLWLDPEVREMDRIEPLLVPYPADRMISFPVGLQVNRPENDDPSCIEPLSMD